MLPMLLNILRTVTVRSMSAERSLSAIGGKTSTASNRPRNGRAENRPFWNHQIQCRGWP